MKSGITKGSCFDYLRFLERAESQVGFLSTLRNGGTETNRTSFAQEWSKITGGKTKAAIGKTAYQGINEFVWWNAGAWLGYKSAREKAGGYSVPFPAFSKPVLGKGAKWKTFKP
ncbi:MAG: hypothetical protein FWG14_06560 [Peptococcaceae bacterium]|nr:hypothetical protein [Peptococcaceae bacterium]